MQRGSGSAKAICLAVVALGLGLLLSAGVAHAEARFTGTVDLSPPQDLSALLGKPIERIEIVVVGDRWGPRNALSRVTVGQVFSPSVARLAMQELVDSGGYANVSSEASLGMSGVILTLRVLPRRLIARIKIPGGVLSDETTLRAAEINRGDVITLLDVPRIEGKVRSFYLQHGFSHPEVRVELVDTDEPMKVVVLIHLEPGASQAIKRRRFLFDREPSEELRARVESYAIDVGERIDEEALTAADHELARSLKADGWYQAEVGHALETTTLQVHVDAGSRVRIGFEGNKSFDATELEAALDLADNDDRSDASLLDRIKEYYRARGFFDVQVKLRRRGKPSDPVIDRVFEIREAGRLRVVDRQYPCLTGARTATELSDEIDGFLTAALPGDTLFSAPDPAVIDSALGPQGTTGARVKSLELEPWATYSPEVYASALQHIQELYRSEGYLSATAGPLQVLRRQCDPRSAPGHCIPIGTREGPTYSCSASLDAAPPESAKETYNCVPDPKRGRYCEPDAVVRIPIHVGPRATLYDIAFEGNRSLLGEQLAKVAALELGAPASYLEIENAQRRIQTAYAEEGFAFAAVEGDLELSPDRTRARAVFVISEREQVHVKDIVVEGAERTREDLILSRAAFTPGSIYRRSDARRTEELLATLGTFSSVSVALEDPDVPARQKTVIISVRERPSQYLEVSPGVSTGEGVRMTMEYGHRNVNGSAIQFRLRTQLGFLPDVLILDEGVRRKYGELPIGRRLERSNTAAVEFPEIGLGPLFRLIVEGVDIRDNSRDYGITKDAALVTLAFRPNNRVTTSLRGSLELNNAEIFGQTEKDALANYLLNNRSPLLQRLLNVPQGQTLAVAQRAALFWDRRDNPFGATRGTFFSFSVEHVNAYSLEDSLSLTSQFLHYTSRVAGYWRFNARGLTLAASLSGGYNQQLQAGSQTYPDRFFFLGGADSIRGFSQDSIIPEDLARRILDRSTTLTANEVTIRGGDVFINPRVELRIPLKGSWQTAIFVDSGNLWLDARRVDPLTLRYSTGTGLRTMTPIGPLALDYGINLDRRPWEDFGAFHFSIGLF